MSKSIIIVYRYAGFDMITESCPYFSTETFYFLFGHMYILWFFLHIMFHFILLIFLYFQSFFFNSSFFISYNSFSFLSLFLMPSIFFLFLHSPVNPNRFSGKMKYLLFSFPLSFVCHFSYESQLEKMIENYCSQSHAATRKTSHLILFPHTKPIETQWNKTSSLV